MTSHNEQIECLNGQLIEKQAEIKRWRDTFQCDDPADAITTSGVVQKEMGRRMREIHQLQSKVERLQALVDSADDHPAVMEEGGTNGIDRCHRVINNLEANLVTARDEVESLKNTIKNYLVDEDQDTTYAAICRAMTGRDETENDRLRTELINLRCDPSERKAEIKRLQSKVHRRVGDQP